MPTLLLICCLLLSGGTSYAKAVTRHPLGANLQTDPDVLESLLQQVKASEEPTLRIFLRLKIAAYLWKHPDDSHDPKALVDAAQKDLDAHEKEIPALYLNLFRRELAAKLKAHDPKQSTPPADEPKVSHLTDLEMAYSLLSQENGAGQAVKLAQRSITAGNDPGPIVTLFLDRLEQVKSEEVPAVLAALMAAEESRPGFIAPGTLFTLKHVFVREQTAPELRRRYLAAVVRTAGDTKAEAASRADTYALLAAVLPVVEKELPDAYPIASIRLQQLAGQVPAGTRERIDVEKRVSESSDPLAQLTAEISTVQDAALKEELQTQAARLALEKGQTRTAIDLLLKLQPKNEDGRVWREQFLEKVVARALDQADVETAEYGAAQIQTIEVRSAALQKIALYYNQRAGDTVSARTTLDAAYKLLRSADHSGPNVGALLDLAGSYAKVDGQAAAEVLRAAVKEINEVPEAAAQPRVTAARPSDVENLMAIAYRLIPAFKSLAEANQYEAKSVASGLQRQDLKAAARFGVYTAVPADNPNQGVAKNR